MVDMEEGTGSSTGEVVDNFAEVFQLPTITGEERRVARLCSHSC